MRDALSAADSGVSFVGPLLGSLMRGFVPFLIVGLGLVLIIIAVRKGAGRDGKQASFGVRAKTFMTPPERRMADLLERSLPGFRIHAQVAMGAILDACAHVKGADRLRIRGRFSQKIVDFVVESRATGEIIALVELDDRTHVPARDQQRDAMTSEAGYRTVRFHRDSWPSTALVRSQILPEHYESRGGHVAD